MEQSKAAEIVKLHNALLQERDFRKTLINDLNNLIKTYRDILGDTNLFDKVADMSDDRIVVGKEYFSNVKSIISAFSVLVSSKSKELNEALNAKITDCGIVLLLNKWDLIDSQQKRDEVMASLSKRMAFAPWIPFINISALTGRATDKVLAAAVKAAEARAQQLKTSELNNLLAEIREGGHTRSEKGRRLKIQYCTQTGSKPPALSFWCNAPDLVDENFERFMENRIRERFELTGTPIRMRFRQKNEGGEK